MPLSPGKAEGGIAIFSLEIIDHTRFSEYHQKLCLVLNRRQHSHPLHNPYEIVYPIHAYYCITIIVFDRFFTLELFQGSHHKNRHNQRVLLCHLSRD